MHGIAIPHAVISSVARNLFRPSFPSSFAKPVTGNTVRLSAIRYFPFLAIRHAPSYRQRKRSLGSASDDDTGRTRFPHILCMMHGIAIPHAVISSAARNLFRPLFPSSFAKPFTESTVRLPAIRCFPFLAVRRSPSYRQRKRSLDFASDDDTGRTRLFHFPRYGVSCFSPSGTLRLAANEKDPSAPLPMTIRETCFSTHSLYDARDSHPPRCHFERSEKSFSSPFSMTSSLSRLREAPSTFLRYGVSHFSFSNTLRLTINEKDPSTSLGMTIRETRLFHFPRYGVSVSCYQTCTINKRAMNKTVHGSFVCTPAGIIPNP